MANYKGTPKGRRKPYFGFRPRLRRYGLVRRRTHLASYFGKGKAESGDLRESTSKTVTVGQFTVAVFAVIETENLLVNVAVKMERLDADIGSAKLTFQKAPEILDAIGMNATINVSSEVIDNRMAVIVFQSEVGHGFIGVDGCASGNHVADSSVKEFSLSSRDNFCVNFSAALKHTHYNGFANRSALVLPLCATLGVHLAKISADESFVSFIFSAVPAARLFAKRTRSHGETDSMKHEPCTLLSDANSPVQFIRTNSVFAVRKHPDRNQPFVERDRRIFKDGIQLHGELATALLTLPAFLSLQVVVLFVAASNASDSIRPAHRGNGINAGLFVAEVLNGVLQGLWVFHRKASLTDSRVLERTWLVKYIIAIPFNPLKDGWLVWDKRETETADKLFGSQFEMACVIGRRYYKFIRMQHCGVKHADGETRHRRFHPTQKPIRLMQRVINIFNPKRIVDPFLGTGTTLLAASLAGIPATGIEIEESYCEIAAKRLSQDVLEFPTMLTSDTAPSGVNESASTTDTV